MRAFFYRAFSLFASYDVSWKSLRTTCFKQGGEDVAEALKAMYNKQFLQTFGEKVHSVYGAFDT